MVDIRFIETHGLFTYEMSEISSNLMLQVFWENDGNHSNGIKNIIVSPQIMSEQLQFLKISYVESFHAYPMEFFENKHYISMS